jgi:hypothetical protein
VSTKTFRPLWTSNTEVSGTTLCPLARPKKAIGHESQIGPWLAILQSLCLSVSRNEWAPSRQGNGTTGRKRNLTVSCDETNHETTSPEEDHSPIASTRSNGWAECRDQKSVGTEPTERNVLTFLFIGRFGEVQGRSGNRFVRLDARSLCEVNLACLVAAPARLLGPSPVRSIRYGVSKANMPSGLMKRTFDSLRAARC